MFVSGGIPSSNGFSIKNSTGPAPVKFVNKTSKGGDAAAATRTGGNIKMIMFME